MSALLPAAFYGLQVPGGNVAIDANVEFPAAIRITMAAIDTSNEYEPEKGDAPKTDNKRCVLKIIRLPYDLDEEDDSEFDSDEEDQLKALINGDMSDSEEDDSEDEEVNGGPSDPEKSKKARKEAATKVLKESLAAVSEELGIDGLGSKGKGKGKLTLLDDEMDEDDEDEDEEDDEDSEIQEFVLCTLDPDNHYQQTLDITIGEKEHVLFKVTGNYSIHLSGNYVIPVDDRRDPYEDEDDEDEEYDLSPDEDELEIDELDDLEDPRIVEVGSEDEEVPMLVDTGKKGKKRPAESDEEKGVGLDEIIGKSLKSEGKTNGEPVLSKKQLKKLKNNAGQSVPVASTDKAAAENSASKKVQFAKNLEQGPTGSTKKETKVETDGGKPANVRLVDGVTVDDRKTGKGPAAKKGSKVSMRYIGKLSDGKVFDSNKSGKPFSFKLGVGEVIKGWDIGIAGMQAGGERRITIPADKAYGKKGTPGIPGNSTLIFDVKCLEIK